MLVSIFWTSRVVGLSGVAFTVVAWLTFLFDQFAVGIYRGRFWLKTIRDLTEWIATGVVAILLVVASVLALLTWNHFVR